MKILIIGDYHSKKTNLNNCLLLKRYIFSILETSPHDLVFFMGDQIDSHAVCDLNVFQFWNEFKKELERINQKCVFLVGNHDVSNNPTDKGSWMDFLSSDLNIVVQKNQFKNISETISAIGYCETKEIFNNIMSSLPKTTRTVFCHQTLVGARYESGVLALDGASIENFKHIKIISGHIHTRQSFENVYYPGSPKWETLSDCNVDKFLVSASENNGNFSFFDFNLASVLGKKNNYVIKEGHEEIPKYDREDLVSVDIYGNQSFVDKMVNKYSNIKKRIFIDQEKQISVKESDGLEFALDKFLREKLNEEIFTEVKRRLNGFS
jgi:predicted phosphodiesterase